MCGFLGHAARLGCNKCKREFRSRRLGNGELSALAEFVAGELRTDTDHREQVRTVKLAKTKQDRKACERSTGVRHTELLRLSYYKPIRFVAIDPMHNVFLETTKHVLKTLWIDEEFENNATVLSKSSNSDNSS